MLGLQLLLVMDTENEITADLIAELLREQHPDLADLPLTFDARGWDNQLWRLGDDLAVRLPWATQDADELLLKEHTLLPAIAPRLPLQIPVPQRLGHPSERFPRPWMPAGRSCPGGRCTKSSGTGVPSEQAAVGDVALSSARAQTILQREAFAELACLVVLGIGPAEAFGCLCAERIAGQPGVAV